MPAAAMLTEQKPPWAAKLGVPNIMAHQPVSDWLWSRPVKKASFLGSVARTSPSHCGREPQGLVPGDLAEVARAARADAQQRRLQPRRRIVLHDAGRALAAQHALVHGMVAVALDVADLAVLEEHADAAAAGAHVAGGGLDLVGRRHREGDLGLARLREGLHQLAFLLPRARMTAMRPAARQAVTGSRSTGYARAARGGMLVQGTRRRQHRHAPVRATYAAKACPCSAGKAAEDGAGASPCRSPRPH